MALHPLLSLFHYPRQTPPTGTSGGKTPLARFARAERFDKILSACRPSTPAETPERRDGLTIPDYLANPVRARVFPVAPKEEATRPPDAAAAEAPPEGGTPPVETAAPGTAAGEGGVTDLCIDLADGMAPAETAEPLSQRQIIDRSVRKAARQYRLPEGLIDGVIRAESGYRADAVSPAGAKGLMQLMPGTARELGVADVFDIEENIDGGARYLRKMLDLFDGDVERALMAYNAGPGTVRRYRGDVPYRETRQYVARVLRYAEAPNEA